MVSFTRRVQRWGIVAFVVTLLVGVAGFVSSPLHAAPLRDPVVNSGPAEVGIEPEYVERVGTNDDAATQAAYPQRVLYNYGYYPARNGARHFSFTDPAIHANSIVTASITEVTANNTPLFGAAQINVANVTTSEGRVDMWVNIGWGSPLRTRVSLEIMQP